MDERVIPWPSPAERTASRPFAGDAAADQGPRDEPAALGTAATPLLGLSRFALVMAVLLAAAALPGSAFFTLRSVQVEGTRRLTPAGVMATAGLRPGTTSIYRLDGTRIAGRLRRHPWIAAAEVRPRFPDTLRVTVRERIPVAAIPHEGRFVLLDAAGVAIEVAAQRPALPLVSERGRALAWVAPGQGVPSSAAREALALLSRLPEPLRQEIAHLQVTREREVIFYTVDGLEVRAGPLRGIERRLRSAPDVLRAVRGQGVALEYVDMRMPDNVIIKPRRNQ